MADSTDYGRGDAVSRGTASTQALLKVLAKDDPLDRLKVWAAAGSGPHYIPEGDALALRACVEEIERLRVDSESLSKKFASALLALGRLRERLDEAESSHEAAEAAHADLIRQLSERVAICSELLGKRAEKTGCGVSMHAPDCDCGGNGGDR